MFWVTCEAKISIYWGSRGRCKNWPTNKPSNQASINLWYTQYHLDMCLLYCSALFQSSYVINKQSSITNVIMNNAFHHINHMHRSMTCGKITLVFFLGPKLIKHSSIMPWLLHCIFHTLEFSTRIRKRIKPNIFLGLARVQTFYCILIVKKSTRQV